MAASLLPASLGTGVASALGLSGAAGGLIAAAAPKALGAGIGTLLAGGDMGDAALNAVGFGAAGAAGNALSSMLSGAPEAAASAAGTTGASTVAAAPTSDPSDAIRAIAQAAQSFGGDPQQEQPAPAMAPLSATQPQAQAAQASSLDFGQPQGQPGDTVNQIAATRVNPTAVNFGLGALPGPNGTAMANQNLMMGLPPGAGDFLRGQGMRIV